MRFTLSWLGDHLETAATLEEICRTLTAIGLEVEGVENRAATLAPFTIAHVLEAAQHPNADRLRVCKVDTGSGINEVVCGAPNARAGIKVVLAREGAKIPASGMVLTKSKIRGVESNGMLCSERELGLGEDHNGIIELPQDAPVGESFAAYAGLDDPVIEINITPNRGDCLGVRGIARDLAAAGLGRLKPLEPSPACGRGQGEGEYPSPVSVTIADPHCAMFVGRHFKNVTNGASPAWMQKRLKAIGLRPISALVDITNYITFDLGRPLHVFDAAKLKGNLAVRPAKEGEKLKGLNGKEYALLPWMTVVADEAGAQGLGGVIGGEATGCGEETRDVFLEVAFFDASQVARQGRALELHTDSRARFERGGVDPAFLLQAAEIATRLILECCGGETSKIAVAGGEPEWRRRIAYRPARALALGGVDVSAARQREILTSLGCEVKEDGGNWQVSPPSWRPDMAIEADVVEEVLRITGYDAIPSTPLPPLSKALEAPLTARKRAASARRQLAARGMHEVYGWAFVSYEQAALFGGGGEALTLQNPISADLSCMRPSILPCLLAMAGRNASRGFRDIALFEVGAQYEDTGPEKQRLMASGIRTGQMVEKNPLETPRACDGFDAKADAAEVLSALGVAVEKLTVRAEAPAWYHPGKSGALTLGGKIVLAYFGEIHPEVAKAFDLSGPVAVFETFLDAIPLPRAKAGKARGPLEASDFQAVTRDFAFLVPRELSAESVAVAVRKAEKILLRDYRLFDVYEGKGMEEGKKSIAFTVTLQAADRTLSEAEIEQACARIVAEVSALGGNLRASAAKSAA